MPLISKLGRNCWPAGRLLNYDDSKLERAYVGYKVDSGRHFDLVVSLTLVFSSLRILLFLGSGAYGFAAFALPNFSAWRTHHVLRCLSGLFHAWRVGFISLASPPLYRKLREGLCSVSVVILLVLASIESELWFPPYGCASRHAMLYSTIGRLLITRLMAMTLYTRVR
jgi:hypothetical protein